MQTIKKEAKIKLLNEVDAVVIGLGPGEYAAICDAFKLQTPNYFFNPKYKAKIWDGYHRFFTKNGKVCINLLPDIIPIIKDFGYEISIIDTRDKISLNVPKIDKHYLADFGWTLGDHQVNAINALTQNNGGMIKGGTGAGKTVCCWVLHDLYYTHCGLETLIIVPTTDLIYQTVLEFNEFSKDVGLWGDSKKDIDHPVVVSTWQTLMNQEDFVRKYKHIIMDECHGGKNFISQANKILNEYGSNCYVKTGMTGTFPPHPCDLRTLRCSLGQILYEIPAKELIDQGWLSTMVLTVLGLDEDLRPDYDIYLENFKPSKKFPKPLTFSEYKKALYPEFANERGYLSKNYERNLFISEFVKAKTEQSGNSVILVNTKKQGTLLEEMIPGSVFIYGDKTTKVRKEQFNMFAERDDVIMITTYGLAAVGLNIKRIFNIFMVDAGKSFVRVIQTLGRGLRKADDKDVVNVYDIYSNLYYSEKHIRERIAFYKEEGHTIDHKHIIKYKGISDDST
jgi:superfamily II DNA or RNA helicase